MKSGKWSPYIKTGAIVAVIMAALFLCFHIASVRAEENAPMLMGATYVTFNNPYYSSVNSSIEEVVEANGDILITRNPMQSQTRQNKEIHEMIEDGIKVLFLNAVDWQNVEPALEECQEAGVAVFAIDSEVEDKKSVVVSTIESDQELIGQLVAEDMMKRLPEGGKIIVAYDYTIRSLVQRMYGFCNTIAGDPRFEVVAAQDNCSEIETTNREMTDLLAEHPDVDVVFAANDPAAIGALASVDQYYGADSDKKIFVYGADGSPDAKQMIYRRLMTGTVAQHPIKIGQEAAEAAYAYLDGESVAPLILTDVELMTAKDLTDTNLTGWQ